MSGVKTCVKQETEYRGEHPDEGSVVTSLDTLQDTTATAAKNEVHSSGHTHTKSMCLKEMSPVKQAGGKGESSSGRHPH